MEALQDDILRVLDLSEKKYISQQEAWNHLVSLKILNPYESRNLKEKFLMAFLTMPSNYNNVYLVLRNSRYYLTSELSSFVDKSNYEPQIDLTLPKSTLLNLITENNCLATTDIIDDNGNTVLHGVCELQDSTLLEKVLSRSINYDLTKYNNQGKSILDLADKKCKEILTNHILEKIYLRNHEISKMITELTKELNQQNKHLQLVVKQSNSYVRYTYIGVIFFAFIGILFKQFS